MTFEDFLRAEAEGIKPDQALGNTLQSWSCRILFEEGTSSGGEIYVGMENGEPVYNLSDDQKEDTANNETK